MDPTLLRLLADESAPLKHIAQHLDALVPEARWNAVNRLSRAAQRELWKRAEQAPPLTVDDFVPAHFPALTPVRHQGLNTLPLPRPLQVFEKRFCRPVDGSARLFGYNEGLTRPLLGPGYFVARSTSGHAAWERRGALVVDYFMVPDGQVSEGWPKVVPNSSGLQVLVYNGTRDFMRRVSNHVTIGAAYKGEYALDHYFVLCREG